MESFRNQTSGLRLAARHFRPLRLTPDFTTTLRLFV